MKTGTTLFFYCLYKNVKTISLSFLKRRKNKKRHKTIVKMYKKVNLKRGIGGKMMLILVLALSLLLVKYFLFFDAIVEESKELNKIEAESF